MCICVYLRIKHLNGVEGEKDTTEELICLTESSYLFHSHKSKNNLSYNKRTQTLARNKTKQNQLEKKYTQSYK